MVAHMIHVSVDTNPCAAHLCIGVCLFECVQMFECVYMYNIHYTYTYTYGNRDMMNKSAIDIENKQNNEDQKWNERKF